MSPVTAETARESGIDRHLGAGVAQFHQLRGWPVHHVAGLYWVPCGTGARWLMSLPHYSLAAPLPGDLTQLLRMTRMLALRYPTDGPRGIPSGLYVCRDRNYSIANVASSARAGVRKGLKRCEIRPVEAHELLRDGIRCNLETMERQGRRNAEFSHPERWERFVDAAYRVPQIHVRGAFMNARLVAYELSTLEDGWYNGLYACAATESRHHHAGEALMFASIESALHRPDVTAVCGGPKELAGGERLHDFKLRLGFAVEAARVAVRFHPLLEPILSSAAVSAGVRLMRNAFPDAEALNLMHEVLRATHELRELPQP